MKLQLPRDSIRIFPHICCFFCFPFPGPQTSDPLVKNRQEGAKSKRQVSKQGPPTSAGRGQKGAKFKRQVPAKKTHIKVHTSAGGVRLPAIPLPPEPEPAERLGRRRPGGARGGGLALRFQQLGVGHGERRWAEIFFSFRGAPEKERPPEFRADPLTGLFFRPPFCWPILKSWFMVHVDFICVFSFLPIFFYIVFSAFFQPMFESR